MRRPLRTSLVALVLLAAGACTNATQGVGAPPSDRVLVTDAQGQVIRQSALSDRATMTFAAPLARVYPAVAAAYDAIGIEANYADRPNGRYGVRNFKFPRELKGERIGTFFSCGSSLTGEVVDNASVMVDAVTTLTAAEGGATNGSVVVAGFARRNEGNSTGVVSCSSTGHLEELLRAAIEKQLAGH